MRKSTYRHSSDKLVDKSSYFDSAAILLKLLQVSLKNMRSFIVKQLIGYSAVSLF